MKFIQQLQLYRHDLWSSRVLGVTLGGLSKQTRISFSEVPEVSNLKVPAVAEKYQVIDSVVKQKCHLQKEPESEAVNKTDKICLLN